MPGQDMSASLEMKKITVLDDGETEAARGGGEFDVSLYQGFSSAEESHFWYDARHRLVARCLQRYFPDAKTLHEAGCGTGGMLAYLAGCFPALRLSGSDPYMEGLRFASGRAGTEAIGFFQAEVSRLPFKGTFDVATAFDVIEHVEDDAGFLADLGALVVPGGGIMLTAPQHRFMWSRWDEVNGHKRRYRRGELARLVEAAGFEVLLDSSFVSFLMPAAMLHRRGSRQESDEWAINPLVNRLAKHIMSVEIALLMNGVRLPAGTSCVVVARKPGRRG